jgi:HAD superfamily hydrolase (TIGR01484 family)
MMRPLRECSPATLAQIRGVLTDIDDTLTTDGELSAGAYLAMDRIRAAGLMLIPVTGRPAGWCDHIARMWPVDAVVGENGAFWFRYNHRSRSMERCFVADAEARRAQRARLETIAAHVLREVPRARVASDQLYRETDLAIDYCEDVARLSAAEVERIVAIMQAHGLKAKVSSIHVNGWFGSHDKLTTTRDLLCRGFGFSPQDVRERFTFVGDSPNDQPMFAFFGCSIGVANVRDFADSIDALPAYITEARCGAGFAEFARLLTDVQSAQMRSTAGTSAANRGPLP